MSGGYDSIINALDLSDLANNQPDTYKEFCTTIRTWFDAFSDAFNREPTVDEIYSFFCEKSELKNDQLPDSINQCANCYKSLSLISEIHTLGIKTAFKVISFKQTIDNELETYPLTLENGMAVKPLIATIDSPARDDGYEMMLVCCSKKCLSIIRKALKKHPHIEKVENIP